MIRTVSLAMAAVALATHAWASEGSHGRLDELIAHHAKANRIPESIIHRVVRRESRYNPRAVGRGGAMGLMQIKHGTARALGYSGAPAGLLDADTNLTYAVKYLAGAYRTANGDPDRTVSYYARGYYYAAKRNHVPLEPAVEQAAAVDVAAAPSDPVARFFKRLTQAETPQLAIAQAQIQAEPVAETRAERRQARRLARLERAKAAKNQAVASAKPEAVAEAVKQTGALGYAAAEPAQAADEAKPEPAKAARGGSKANAVAARRDERAKVAAAEDTTTEAPDAVTVPLPPKRDPKLALRTTLPASSTARKIDARESAGSEAAAQEAASAPAAHDSEPKPSRTLVAKVSTKRQKGRISREATAQDADVERAGDVTEAVPKGSR